MKREEKFKSGHLKKVVRRWSRIDGPSKEWILCQKGKPRHVDAYKILDNIKCFDENEYFMLVGDNAKEGLKKAQQELITLVNSTFKKLKTKEFRPLCANGQCEHYETVEEFGDVCDSCYKGYLWLEDMKD